MSASLTMSGSCMDSPGTHEDTKSGGFLELGSDYSMWNFGGTGTQNNLSESVATCGDLKGGDGSNSDSSNSDGMRILEAAADESSWGLHEMLGMDTSKGSAGTQRHTCTKCSRSFSDISEYEYHVKSHDTYEGGGSPDSGGGGGDGDDDDDDDDDDTSGLDGLENVRYNDEDEPSEEVVVRKCQQCQETFDDDRKMNEHQKMHQVNVKHECEVCNGIFSSIGSLLRHKTRIHDNQKTYECKLCGVSFLNTQALYTHRDSHIQESIDENKSKKHRRGYKCMVCLKVYSRKTKLFEHMDVHSENNATCEYCNQKFTFFALQTHIKKIHMHEVCQICNKSFFDKNVFINHEKDHFKVNNNTCDYCFGFFEEQEILSSHMMTEHVGNSDEHKCDVCSKVYHSERHLKHHRSFNHLTCELCDKKFNKQSHLSSHLKLSHKSDGVVKCKLCSAVFQTRARLAFHLAQTHSVESPYRCKYCKKQFTKYRLLSEHIKSCRSKDKASDAAAAKKQTSDGDVVYMDAVEMNYDSYREKKFNCNYCEKIYNCQANLKKHVLRRHKDQAVDPNVKYHECKVCSKSFISNYELTVHMNVHSEERTHTCELCNKSYKYLANLLQHNAVAHSGKNYECEHCKKIFKCEVYLKIHMARKHTEFVTDVKVYTCEQCTKVFPNQYYLKSHMSVHSEDRPYVCKICNQSYKTDPILKRHLRVIHQEKKTSECEFCKEVFTTTTILNLHKYRKHRSQVPQDIIEKYDSQKITCKVCDKVLSNKSRLSNHMRTHSKEKPLQCAICDQKFTVKYSLMRHMRNAHSVNSGSGSSTSNAGSAVAGPEEVEVQAKLNISAASSEGNKTPEAEGDISHSDSDETTEEDIKTESDSQQFEK